MNPNQFPQAPQQQPPNGGPFAYGQQPLQNPTIVPQGTPQQYATNAQSMMPTPPQPTVPAPKTNPNSTQNSLQIAEIRDGVVIMSDGSFRSVVMSPTEREAVEYSYQGFLNSLYFPIQIFVRSQKVDIRPYIEKLDKVRSEHDNMLLALLMEDYIGFMSELAQQTNIMNKRFYIVIPYYSELNTQKAVSVGKSLFGSLLSSKQQKVVINEVDLEKAKTELRNRVQAVLSGLMQTGVQGLPLDTQELIELYYDAYNPDTATRQALKNFDDLSVPVITKGQGAAPTPQLNKVGM
jgi:hypothetical protein